MKKLLSLFVFCFWSSVYAQVPTPTDTYNSIVSFQPRIATTVASELDSIGKVSMQVQYLDGAGQGIQTIHYKASPAGKDIISGYSTLDALGRPERGYLTTPTTAETGVYQSGIHALASSFYGGDTNPYSEITQYQASPMAVPLKSIGAGQAFRSGTGKVTESSYKTAGAGIRKYLYRDNTEADVNGTFSNGDLIKTIRTDEDGNQIIEYKDGVSGLLYESHQKDKGNTNLLVTTYIYDKLSRLKYVLPPKATTAALANVGTGKLFDQADALFLEGIYATNYNEWGLISESHKPGGGWSYTVYNELEQAVLSQDDRLKANNLWLWTKMDGHGRTIMSGTITKSSSRAALQNSFFDSGAAQQFEERSSAAGNLYGYTNTSFPSGINPAATDVKSIYYYDDYSWVNDTNLNFSQYKTPKWTNAKGLATGSMVKRLDNNTFLKSVSYYDDKNRVIQTKTQNRFGSINQTDIVYNFPGEVLEERTIYRKPGQTDLVLRSTYKRDKQGRVLSTVHYLNGKATPLATYVYDEIGRLKQKSLMAATNIIIEDDAQPDGDTDFASQYILLNPGTYTAANGTYLACVLPNALQKIDYAYDIRGQLRGINTDANGNISLTNGDLFGMKLDHHETSNTYNGKIAKQTWQTPSGSRSYTYSYDGYDRLSGASYTGQGNENYTVSPISYDANGNLSNLQRNGYNGSSWSQIDNLDYQYFSSTYGNQTKYVKDNSGNTKGFKDNGGGGTNDDYTYYPDGSLKSDANKGISNIDYNFLGLPEKIEFGSSIRIENTYDAEGLLLFRKFINGSTTTQTDYTGSLIYENGLLESIMHEEGRIKLDNGSLTNPHYQFFISDHLGNTRSIIERIDNSTALVQEVHYYPYGAVMEGIGIAGDWDFTYQGKEYIDFNGTNLYDFNSRSYDAYLGRFTSLDGANQFASGYVGMGNMPTVGVDPDGQSVLLAIGIGAAFGAFIGGAQSDMAGNGFLNGALKGAVIGGLGGLAGYFAPIGILPGFGYGAATGAGLGALSAGINGTNVGRGALMGGITGGVLGGISGYLKTPEGVNHWSGNGQSNSSLGVSTPQNGQYYESNAEMRNSYNATIGNVDNMDLNYIENKIRTKVSLAASYNLPSDDYSIESHFLYDKINNSYAGAITSSAYKYGFLKSSNIFISPGIKGFSLNMQNNIFKHEFMHAWHLSSGFKNYNKYSERATSTFSLAYTKAHNITSQISITRNALSQAGGSIYPSIYSWRNFNKIIPLWIK